MAERNLFYEQLELESDGDYVEVVRCRDCKHKPTITKTGVWGAEDENGELEDYACPFLVYEDNYYNRMPNEDDFCSRAERKEQNVENG